MSATKPRPPAPAEQREPMALWKRVYETSAGAERDEALLAALDLCRSASPLPEWVYQGLRELVKSPLLDPGRIWARWSAVAAAKMTPRNGERAGKMRRTTWNEAYQTASNQLAGTPYAGKARTMRASYERGQDILKRADY